MLELFGLVILMGMVLWAFFSTHPDHMPRRWTERVLSWVFLPLPIFTAIIVGLWSQGELDMYAFLFLTGLAFGMTAVGGFLYALQQHKPHSRK